MSSNDGGPAFPQQELSRDVANEPMCRGMSLRDYFAGQALMGLTRHEAPHQWAELGAYPTLAAVCYEMADAMIAERGKGS